MNWERFCRGFFRGSFIVFLGYFFSFFLVFFFFLNFVLIMMNKRGIVRKLFGKRGFSFETLLKKKIGKPNFYFFLNPFSFVNSSFSSEFNYITLVSIHLFFFFFYSFFWNLSLFGLFLRFFLFLIQTQQRKKGKKESFGSGFVFTFFFL